MALVEIELDVGVSTGGRDRSGRFGQRGPTEVGVQEHPGGVDDLARSGIGESLQLDRGGDRGIGRLAGERRGPCLFDRVTSDGDHQGTREVRLGTEKCTERVDGRQVSWLHNAETTGAGNLGGCV